MFERCCNELFTLPIILGYIGFAVLGMAIGLTVGLFVLAPLIGASLGFAIGLGMAVLYNSLILIIKNFICRR